MLKEEKESEKYVVKALSCLLCLRKVRSESGASCTESDIGQDSQNGIHARAYPYEASLEQFYIRYTKLIIIYRNLARRRPLLSPVPLRPSIKPPYASFASNFVFCPPVCTHGVP